MVFCNQLCILEGLKLPKRFQRSHVKKKKNPCDRGALLVDKLPSRSDGCEGGISLSDKFVTRVSASWSQLQQRHQRRCSSARVPAPPPAASATAGPQCAG